MPEGGTSAASSCSYGSKSFSMPGKSFSLSSSPPSGGAGRSTRSGSSGTGRKMPLPERSCGLLFHLWYRCHLPLFLDGSPRKAGGAITSSGLPRLLGPAEADLTFTEVLFSKPQGKILKNCCRKRLFLTHSGFPLVLLRQLLAVLELVDRFTL